MLLRIEDVATMRVEAAALTELALGESRKDTAFRLAAVSVAVLSETDKSGTRAGVLADRLRAMADQLDAMVVTP
jgi:hypothetical protein